MSRIKEKELQLARLVVELGILPRRRIEELLKDRESDPSGANVGARLGAMQQTGEIREADFTRLMDEWQRRRAERKRRKGDASQGSERPSMAPPPLSPGPPPLSSAPPPFGSGPPPLSSAPPPFGSGPPPLSSAPPPFGSGPPPLSSAPPPFGSGPPPLSSAPPPFSSGPPPLSSAPPPGSGPPPLSSGPPPLSSNSPSFSAGPPPLSSNPPSLSSAPLPLSSAPTSKQPDSEPGPLPVPNLFGSDPQTDAPDAPKSSPLPGIAGADSLPSLELPPGAWGDEELPTLYDSMEFEADVIPAGPIERPATPGAPVADVPNLFGEDEAATAAKPTEEADAGADGKDGKPDAAEGPGKGKPGDKASARKSERKSGRKTGRKSGRKSERAATDGAVDAFARRRSRRILALIMGGAVGLAVLLAVAVASIVTQKQRQVAETVSAAGRALERDQPGRALDILRALSEAERKGPAAELERRIEVAIDQERRAATAKVREDLEAERAGAAVARVASLKARLGPSGREQVEQLEARISVAKQVDQAVLKAVEGQDTAALAILEKTPKELRPSWWTRVPQTLRGRRVSAMRSALEGALRDAKLGRGSAARSKLAQAKALSDPETEDGYKSAAARVKTLLAGAEVERKLRERLANRPDLATCLRLWKQVGVLGGTIAPSRLARLKARIQDYIQGYRIRAIFAALGEGRQGEARTLYDSLQKSEFRLAAKDASAVLKRLGVELVAGGPKTADRTDPKPARDDPAGPMPRLPKDEAAAWTIIDRELRKAWRGRRLARVDALLRRRWTSKDINLKQNLEQLVRSEFNALLVDALRGYEGQLGQTLSLPRIAGGPLKGKLTKADAESGLTIELDGAPRVLPLRRLARVELTRAAVRGAKDKAEARYRGGVLAYAEGDRDTALRILGAQRSSKAVLILRVLLGERPGVRRPPPPQGDRPEIAPSDAKSSNKLYLAAVKLWREDRLPEAWQKAKAAEKADPDNGSVHGLLGYLHFDYGRFKEARESLARAVKLNKGWAGVQQSIEAKILFLYNQDDEARKVLAGISSPRGSTRYLATMMSPPGLVAAKSKKGHYIVYGDEALVGKEGHLYAARLLDLIYKAYSKVFPFPKDEKVVYRCYILSRRERFLEFSKQIGHSGEGAAGYFAPGTRILVIDADARGESTNPFGFSRNTINTVFHEGFHQFINLYVPNIPIWFNEGLADYFGPSIVLGATKLKVGHFERDSEKLLTRYQRITRSVKGESGYMQPLPLAEFLSQSRNAFMERGQDRVRTNYAQGWSFMHFLLHGKAMGRKGRSLIKTYFKAMLDGQTKEEAFAASFGKLNLEKLDVAWRQYVQSF